MPAWELLGASNGCVILRRSDRHAWAWRVLLEAEDGTVRSDTVYESMTDMIRTLWDSILEPGPVARALAMAARAVPVLRTVWQILARERAKTA